MFCGSWRVSHMHPHRDIHPRQLPHEIITFGDDFAQPPSKAVFRTGVRSLPLPNTQDHDPFGHNVLQQHLCKHHDIQGQLNILSDAGFYIVVCSLGLLFLV